MDLTAVILKDLEPGRLERLAGELLPRMNYEWDNLIPTGTVPGTAQTRRATPDLWKETQEGGYIYVQATKDRAKGKIFEDLDKSINKLVELNKSENALCIAFVSSDPLANEIAECKSLCAKNGSTFLLLNNNLISKELNRTMNHDLRYKYLNLPGDIPVDPRIVMEHKKERYIPLLEELDQLQKENIKSSFFIDLDMPFIKTVITQQHRYKVNNELLSDLNELVGKIKSFKLLSYSTYEEVIINFFTEGFTELYGRVIEGQMELKDNEGEVIHIVDVEADEFELIRMMVSNSKYLKLVIDQLNDVYDWNYDEVYMPELANIIKNSLAERNRKHKSTRIPIVTTNLSDVEYIMFHKDFTKYFYNDKKVKDVLLLKEEITDQILAAKQKVLKVIKYIEDKYEAF
ncbi:MULTISPECIES: hypothetical protein [unclassified Paenibacillus]|uniref:hypothetical protein n=1 Tax=unclassified Paenibacillus TaxID=185978 RepID=UPI0009A6ACE1|nr:MULTISPECIES: hypothetical protein [unclassified Paenibacillus]SLK12953.1 hypothetical protein SAMN06272722_10823 [Paenibacillus sp. RU5A]SOC72797.1 hypothetical protein SAMN05880581_10823 [Paenibacillus sp. RU26A]SOC75052.1 hypothetical protein SAMN05880586_10823 [Paenibacillus sp. RU5M]